MPRSRDGLVEQLQSCLKRDQTIFYTPESRQNITYVYDSAQAVLSMAEGDIPYGIYNLASENELTDYETKAYILRYLGADSESIRRLLKASQSSRPFDLRAVPYNLKLAGYRLPPFMEGLECCMGGDTK